MLCPECRARLVDLKTYMYCRRDGLFDRSLNQVEATRGELKIAENMARYLEFLEKLKPMLEEKKGLLVKRKKWRIEWIQCEDGPDILSASRIGFSIYRPGTGGPYTSYLLTVEYYPGFPPPDIASKVSEALREGLVPPLDRDYLEKAKNNFSKTYGGYNSAGLDIIFTPEITGDAVEYCGEQKTILKLGMHGLSQTAFIALDGERIKSRVTGRLRGYVKHHFPEIHQLISEMEGWE